MSVLLALGAPPSATEGGEVGFSKRAEAQLRVAKRALDPGVFKLATAERALNLTINEPTISTHQYVRACVMYGVLLLARDDEVKATHWFEKAFHKTLNVSLVSVLGPAVRNYGPKINDRFDAIKREFEQARPALKTNIDFDVDPVEQPPEDLEIEPANAPGRLLVEITDAVGPVRVVIDGVEAGATEEVLFAGKIFHYFSVRPPAGKYVLQLLAENSSPSTKFDVVVAAGKQTRVHVTAPEPKVVPAARDLPPKKEVHASGPNVLVLSSFIGAGVAGAAALALAGVTGFLALAPDVPENDRRTMVSSAGIATGMAVLGAAVLGGAGVVASTLAREAPEPEPVRLPPAPEPPTPNAVAEVSEPDGSSERVALFWKTKK